MTADWIGIAIGLWLIFIAGFIAGLRCGWMLWRETYVSGRIEPMRRRGWWI